MKNHSTLRIAIGLLFVASSLFSNEIPKLNYVNSTGHLSKSNSNNNWTLINESGNQYPVRAYGTPVSIDGYTEVNSTNIEKIAESFVKQFADELKINPEQLKFASFRSFNSLYYVTLKQYYKGVEVLKSEVELRIRKDAKLVAYGIKYYDDINMEVTPMLSSSQAIAKALDIISTNKDSDKLQSTDKLYILPKKVNGKTKYSLVYNVLVENNNEFTKVSNYIDANTADIVDKKSLVNNANTNVKFTANVNPIKPNEQSEVPMPYLNFSNGYTNYQTDSAGLKSIELTSPATITGTLSGKFTKVSCFNSSTSSISNSIQPGIDNNLNIDNSTSLRERNAYYYLNLARQYLLDVDPAISSYISDNYINIELYYNTVKANASSNGETLKFVGLGDASVKTLNVPDVLFHEYGHSINYFLYYVLGNSYYGMENTACNEALADVYSATYLDEHLLCKYLVVNEDYSFTRDMKNKNIYPDSLDNESHHDGLILSGALWDLREMTSLAYFQKITHFAKYGLPDDEEIGIAFEEWLVETLIADDNLGEGNNDLSDGTPFSNQIVLAFANHKIGISNILARNLKHTPIENFDKERSNLNFSYSYDFQLGSILKIDSTFLVYSFDGFKTSKRKKSSNISASNYNALIDYIPGGTIVQYYFESYINMTNMPIRHYYDNSDSTTYKFLVGYKKEISEAFVGSSWINGGYDDNASIGQWECSFMDYNSQYEENIPGVMPKSDISGDNKILVTDPIFDLDCIMYGTYNKHFTNGKTSIISPIYNTSQMENPVVLFYNWFILYCGLEDYETHSLNVDFSYNGGATWKNVLTLNSAYHFWKKHILNCNKSDEFQIRFVLDVPETYYDMSYYTKAFIDDIGIWSSTELGVENDISQNNSIKIYPSPATNYVSIIAESTSNISILNSLGESIAEIENSDNVYKWDLRDSYGNKVPAGVYFCKIKQNNSYLIEKILITD